MASVEITKLLMRSQRMYDGYLDGMNGNVLYGWALNVSDPEHEVIVSIHHNGAQIGEMLARDFRLSQIDGFADLPDDLARLT